MAKGNRSKNSATKKKTVGTSDRLSTKKQLARKKRVAKKSVSKSTSKAVSRRVFNGKTKENVLRSSVVRSRKTRMLKNNQSHVKLKPREEFVLFRIDSSAKGGEYLGHGAGKK